MGKVLKSKVYDVQEGIMVALNDPLVDKVTFHNSPTQPRIFFILDKERLRFLPDEGKEIELVFNKKID